MKKIAFAGFRHGHIYSLYAKAKKSPETEIVAACEEDAATRESLKSNQDIKITCDSIDKMLEETDCDIVAIGDYYTKRGSIAIKALRAGKHVIADKPLCTSLKELDIIAGLSAKSGLKVGCMFDLRCVPNFIAAREIIGKGTLGKITQIQFGGQHPLNRKVRPSWYFEPGKHGGTINDIASHAADIIPWLTGLDFKDIIAARTWQASETESKCFNDAAQFMLEMDNGCGVLGDVSYSAPDSLGFSMPTYWRFNIWGKDGMIEFNCTEKGVKLYQSGMKEVSVIAPPEETGADCLDSLLADIAGKKADLNTAVVLKAARTVLEIQKKADDANSK